MGLLDTLKAALAGDAKKATDSMAAKGSVAGTIRERRDAALRAADDPDGEIAERRRRQHSQLNH